jgi:hypothetical protein
MNPAFLQVIGATDGERRDLFLAAATRLGTTAQNVEKDFWVCWTLDALFNGLAPGGPRLLFKGGTSLSKAFGLIARFSEDIDVTVFRQDIGEPAAVEELEALSGKKRAARLDGIKAACRAHIHGRLLEQLTRIAEQTMREAGSPGELRVASDDGDPDGQSLLLWYPSVASDGGSYVRSAVKIESGAKSALDPHAPMLVKPYVANEMSTIDLSVPGVTTVDAGRTFWDKVVILHGLRRWYERRGELRGGGQRVSRHYYDVHCLMHSDVGVRAVDDVAMATDCVPHAQMFFNRPDLDLATAAAGTFALAPHDGMAADLRRDYAAMSTMIFGEVPTFDEVMASIARLESTVNDNRSAAG